MKFLTCILFVLTLFSCSSKVTYYEYKGTTVTRVDHDGEILFYYGKCSENSECPYVKAQYHGFNSGVDALLLFREDGAVEVIPCGMGYFIESNKKNKKIIFKRYNNYVLDSLVKSYNGNFDNLIRISNVIALEKEVNLDNKSKVKAEYPQQ